MATSSKELAADRLGVRPLLGSGCRRACSPAAGLVLVLATGCVGLGSLVPGHQDKPPSMPACQVVATWSNQVVFTPDPTRNGEPTPGLAGRVYLFGQTIDYPVAGDGTVVVELFDDAHPNPHSPLLPLEKWCIDRDTLKRLVHRDAIGWGYTLFLPWGTYRPDITRVHLRLRYDPVDGSPLFASSAPLTLNKDSNDFGMGNQPPALPATNQSPPQASRPTNPSSAQSP